ncbi:MAG: hypothetical protein LUQ38_03915 [Methanotrichaceae archaeon]|nr:hypothetical protein [Methanotrichaceae archaeon]
MDASSKELNMAEDIPIGKCILSLDIGGKNLAVKPTETTVKKDFIMDMTQLFDYPTLTSGFIYIYDFPETRPVANCESSLETSMKISCDEVSTEPYGNGFIGNGLSTIGEQKCWGVALPLDLANGKMKRMLMVISSFKNETFNEQLVKSIKIEDLHCPE